MTPPTNPSEEESRIYATWLKVLSLEALDDETGKWPTQPDWKFDLQCAEYKRRGVRLPA